jgi:hypothetical protein
LRGTIPGGREVVAEIERVIAQVRSGDILQPGGSQQARVFLETGGRRERRIVRRNTFYEIESARRIFDVLDYTAAHCAIGCITSAFGTGKTEAVKEWRRRTAGKVESIVFEFDEFSCRSVVDFVRALSEKLGIDCAPGFLNGGTIFRGFCWRG